LNRLHLKKKNKTMNTTKTELLEEMEQYSKFIPEQYCTMCECHDDWITENGEEESKEKYPWFCTQCEDASEIINLREQFEDDFKIALDRYRDSVVEEAYKNGFKDGMNNRERTSKKIFNIVSKYQTHHGYPPTLKEIKDAFGAKSITTVQRALVNLKKMGLISQNKYQKRAWYIPTIPMVLREQTNNNTTKE